MWLIIVPLVGGYLLSLKAPGFVSRIRIDVIVNISLVLLLMVMGARIGADSQVVGQIATLGLQAFVLAWATVLGSVGILFLFQFAMKQVVVEVAVDEGIDEAGSSYGFTLMLLGSVLAGILLGIWLLPESLLPMLSELTVWVLGLLLLGVGLDLGKSSRVFASLRTLGYRIVFLPLGVIIGSILGAALLVFVWDILSWQEAAALASGFGWYSLSSVIISEVSPVLGAMAFIANVFRELIAIVITPLVAKWVGKFASIGPAGATAMDVLIPVISKGTGREYVPLAFFSGAVLSLSVPFFVNLFISLF